jgi:2-polyprenyl-6-methoxyphenol hydroxylase-like FAD-dependent oxidoreductase
MPSGSTTGLTLILRLTDAYGAILHDHPRRMSGAGKRPEIERGPLRDLLLDSLRPGTVEWNCKLESAAMQGEQVLLRFASGKTALADMAIGSDGANSRFRELVTPIRPEYVGVSLAEGLVPAAKQTIPKLWDLLGGSALIALGGERTIGMGTKPEDARRHREAEPRRGKRPGPACGMVPRKF